MKRHSKLLSLVLSLAMLMAFAMPIMAAPPDDGSITITAPASLGLAAGDFKAYQLFTVKTISPNGANTAIIYELVPAVAPFLAQTSQQGKYGAAAGVAPTPAQFLTWLQGQTSDSAAMIALAKELTIWNETAEAITAIPAAQIDDNTVKFGNTTRLALGYYLVTGAGQYTDDTDDPKHANDSNGGVHDGKVFSRSMLFSIPRFNTTGNVLEYDVGCTLKADAPQIDKQVWYHGDQDPNTKTPADGGTWTNETDVNIGNTVYFKLESKVPDMTGYETYQFIVHDYMSKGLTFDDSGATAYDKVKVTIGGVTVNGTNLGGLTYTVTTNTSDAGLTGEYEDGTYIKIEFDRTKFVNLDKDDPIVITYSAELNEEAIIGNPGNPNKVKLQYSNNPNKTGTGTTAETPEHEVRVHTFKLEIFKFTGSQVALPGAQFELRVGSKTGAKVSVVPDGSGVAGRYRLVTSEDVAADALLAPGSKKITTTLVSGADGKIIIKGLDAGTYFLEETLPPPGYNGLVGGWVTNIVIARNSDKTTPGGGYSMTIEGEPENTVNVENNTGGLLPGTGGIGTYIFYGIGIAMAILLAAAFIIYRRRKTLGALDAA